MYPPFPDPLIRQLEPLVAQAAGPVAVAAVDMETDERWSLDGDRVFPAASLIKVPLAVAAYQAVERGELALFEPVAVTPVAGDDEAEWDNLGLAPAGVRHSWQKVIDRMLTESDNAATNALIDRLGLAGLAGLTAALGLTRTALRRRMLDAEARAAGRENETTAEETATLLAALAGGALLSSAHTRELLGVLGEQRDRDKLAAGIPADVPLANKTGELPGLRHDAGIVAGRWVLAVLATGEKPADVLIGRIGTVVYAFLEAREERRARAAAWLTATRAEHLPDPRLGHDTLETAVRGAAVVLRGATTQAARLEPPAGLAWEREARHLKGRPGVVTVPCLQLRRAPGHAQELVSQLRLGDPVTLLDEGPDWTLLRGPDGYAAYGKTNNLRPLETAPWTPTHMVSVPLTLARTEDGHVLQLSAGSRLMAEGEPGRYRLPAGPTLRVPEPEAPPGPERGTAEALVALALRFMGLPYLWGGATGWGLDCSGLVQLCHAVLGAPLPRDADQQQLALPAIAAVEALLPGDCVFFPGHVGLYVGDGEFVHASAQAGCVTVNSFDRASPRFDPWLFENFTGGGRTPLRREGP